MKKETQHQQLEQLLRTEYDLADDDTIILPSSLASTVYRAIDPTKKAPFLVQYAALLELRQMARTICAEKFSSQEKEFESNQESLFPSLQRRYPAQREGDQAYVPRAQLTYDERMANVYRLRKEAQAKSAHADALEAETHALVDQGVLQAETVAQ